MAKHNKLGKKGEDIAYRFLVGKGFNILDRNWRHQKDEVDIIAMDGKFIVFVEVKTRSTAYFGDPDDAVDNKKQRFLIRAAEAYVESKEIFNEIRYDIISIIIEGNTQRINHIEDAFYPTLYN